MMNMYTCVESVRRAVCFVLVPPPALLLLLVSSVVQLGVPTISPFLLPRNTVKLLEFETILCHTPNNHLLFTVKFNMTEFNRTECSVFKHYSVNVRESLGRNPELRDSSGRQWYNLSYTKDVKTLRIYITGKTTLHTSWRRAPLEECSRNTLIFRFPHPETNLARYSKNKTFSTSTKRNKPPYNGLDLYRDLMKEIMKNKHPEHHFPTSVVFPYALGSIFGFAVYVRCCLYSHKSKVVERVRTVTITRRIPILDSGSSSPSHTDHQQYHHPHQQCHHQQDLPPSYDDICLEELPPSFSEVQAAQCDNSSLRIPDEERGQQQ
ncbi:uncharacterized protein LOC121872894 [Homarus americanus]|uniref:Uncharacterized protein n=1 Tax=Homarus americanus TaxID=6706 RepID=A0A8J5MTT3_HOMAM|nr:uncharacterized protein LOC121872894 [Homarus americanus]KAG7163266.1 hypothetical protein Hamer_G004375 [Homarus americanus]